MSRYILHEITAKAKKYGLEGDEKRQWIDEQFQKEIGELAQTLVDSLNSTGTQELAVKGFEEGIQHTHRYLQGEFWKMMVEVIKKYGESKYFDARNEWAVEMCKRMGEAAYKF